MTYLSILGVAIAVVFITVAFLSYLSTYPFSYVDEGISRYEFDKQRRSDITKSVIGVLIGLIVAYIGTL